MNLPPATLLAAAFLASAALVRVMIRVGVMDIPVHRSSHTRPIPKGGGIGIIAAFLLFLPPLRWSHGLPPLDLPTTALLTAILLLSIVSWLDDLHSFPARYKLATQALAAFLIATTTPLPITGPLWYMAIAAATAWLMLITNAVNFIDGINGLASGTLATIGLGVALLAPTQATGCTAALIAACLLGFLPFNYPKAKIFMGDVGSQSTALIIGTLALTLTNTPSHPLQWLVPMMLSGILFDVLFTLARRTLAGARLSEAHRGHLYQLATRTSLPAPAITALHWLFALWGLTCATLILPTTNLALTSAVLLLPQILWTTLICHRAIRHDIGIW